VRNSIFILMTVLVVSMSVRAQNSNEQDLTGFRRGLATVMLASLGGAIVGISTLSFYGEPQEHVSNILTGLALGAAGGTAYVFSPRGDHPSVALARSGPTVFYTWYF